MKKIQVTTITVEKLTTTPPVEHIGKRTNCK